MIRIFQNLRIASKLAITSTLGVLLVGLMIYSQKTGGDSVRKTFEYAIGQQTIAESAAEAQGAIRGMQIGIRDLLLSTTVADLKKATEYFHTRQSDGNTHIDIMLKLSHSAENRARMTKLATLVAEFGRGAAQIAAMRNEAILLEAKSAAGDAAAISQTAKINEDISRVRHTVTLPVYGELENVVSKIAEFGKHQSEKADADATSEAASVERTSLIIGIATAFLLIATSVFSVLTIARPMRALARSMVELAEGNFAVIQPGLGRKDEIGDVAAAVEKFKSKAEQKALDEAAGKVLEDERVATRRKQDMTGLADEFERSVSAIIDTVSTASTQLEESAGILTETADRSQSLTTTVATASQEASTNVRTVAAATEEMASSVNEISRQVQASARIASEAVLQADKTNDRIANLAEAANRIGDVVELINNIAGQTNLLALNATIEAARAGESGRGFAVVAAEVKALAQQTAKATGEISQQVTGMQAATQQSVEAIREIGATIGQISEIASTIASAVEEQGVTTQEISRNVQQAAQGTTHVTSNIAQVQRGASDTGAASSQVLAAAQSLSRDSHMLKSEVGKFLSTVRMA